MHTPLALLLLLCLGLVHFVHSQQCNDTYAYSFTQTVNAKMNSTYKLRIGLVGGYLVPEVNNVLAMTHVINNDLSILKDVEIQLYLTIYHTTPKGIYIFLQVAWCSCIVYGY